MKYKLFYTLQRKNTIVLVEEHISFSAKTQSFIPFSKHCLCLNNLAAEHQSALGTHETENGALPMHLAVGCLDVALIA